MSGLFRKVKDVFGGGAEEKAAKKQVEAIEQGQQITRQSAAEARSDLLRLFPAAQQNVQQGFQGALDVFGQSLPAQTGVFTQGNIGAQQALIAGLPQFQNAILGGNVDLSGFQPVAIQQPDLSFFQQQLSQPVDPFAPQPVSQEGFGPAVPGRIQSGRGVIDRNIGIADHLVGRFGNRFR